MRRSSVKCRRPALASATVKCAETRETAPSRLECDTRPITCPSTCTTSPVTYPSAKFSGNHHGSTTTIPPGFRCPAKQARVASSSAVPYACPIELNRQVIASKRRPSANERMSP
jgi:hypothetical protein